MCEPVTITAITTAAVTAAQAAATAAAATAAAVASAATAAASGVAAIGSGVASGVGSATTAFIGAELSTQIAIVGAVGAVGAGIAQGVEAEETKKEQKKGIKRDAASQKIAALNASQQSAEASAEQQLDLSRKAIAAKGTAKASNLGDRSVAALSRAVGFELGSDKTTLARNQQIVNQETSARLHGINVSSDSRRAAVGETGGVTLGLNAAGSAFAAAGTGLQIRNNLSK